MSDGRKSCLGIGFLVIAMALAGLGVFSGGVGSIVAYFGGDSFGINLQTGAILGVGAFAFFFALSIYTFIKIKDWAWIPAILSGVYAVLPDIILGPEDDIIILILGGLASAFLAWWRDKSAKKKELAE